MRTVLDAQELADLTGLSPATVYNVESERSSQPDNRTLEGLSAALGVAQRYPVRGVQC